MCTSYRFKCGSLTDNQLFISLLCIVFSVFFVNVLSLCCSLVACYYANKVCLIKMLLLLYACLFLLLLCFDNCYVCVCNHVLDLHLHSVLAGCVLAGCVHAGCVHVCMCVHVYISGIHFTCK